MGMKRRNLLGLLLAFLTGTVVGQDFRHAPSDSTLGERAARFAKNKKVGAWSLLGGLAVASAWIGFARHRQRQQRNSSRR
jgi:hypothetical protein